MMDLLCPLTDMETKGLPQDDLELKHWLLYKKLVTTISLAPLYLRNYVIDFGETTLSSWLHK